MSNQSTTPPTALDIDEVFSGYHSEVPEHLRDGLLRYVRYHQPPGHFLRAVLSNDLKEAFGRADEQSRAGMFAIVRWLYNDAPSICWGSPQLVKDWLAESGAP